MSDPVADLADGYRDRLRRELLDRPPAGDLRAAAERAAWSSCAPTGCCSTPPTPAA